MAVAMEATHPSYSIFSTTSPGFSAKIGPLKECMVTLQSFLLASPDVDFYEEL